MRDVVLASGSRWSFDTEGVEMIGVNTNYGQANDNARQVIRRTKQVTRPKFDPTEKA